MWTAGVGGGVMVVVEVCGWVGSREGKERGWSGLCGHGWCVCGGEAGGGGREEGEREGRGSWNFTDVADSTVTSGRRSVRDGVFLLFLHHFTPFFPRTVALRANPSSVYRELTQLVIVGPCSSRRERERVHDVCVCECVCGEGKGRRRGGEGVVVWCGVLCVWTLCLWCVCGVC